MEHMLDVHRQGYALSSAANCNEMVCYCTRRNWMADRCWRRMIWIPASPINSKRISGLSEQRSLSFTLLRNWYTHFVLLVPSPVQTDCIQVSLIDPGRRIQSMRPGHINDLCCDRIPKCFVSVTSRYRPVGTCAYALDTRQSAQRRCNIPFNRGR